MIIYRITKEKYVFSFNGKGAAKFGNRWNSKGTEVIYCAESSALAFAELSVYLNVTMASTEYVMLIIEVQKHVKIKEISKFTLPENWSNYPHLKNTQIIGDEFVQDNEFAIMKVPSAIVQGNSNYVINPNHKNFKDIEVVETQSFPIDSRFFR